MNEYLNEISLAKDTVNSAISALKNKLSEIKKYQFDNSLAKEMKAEVDSLIEEIILEKLTPTGLDILSEEIGSIKLGSGKKKRWVVDPLDGTVNFIRGLGACGISVALCLDNQPIFGVIGTYPSCDLVWGGRGMGAFLNNFPIQVSMVSDKLKAVLCTGVPSRFDFTKNNFESMYKDFESFGKIRMLGSASISLLQVAKGSADAYCEKNIMIWDVAAGLAILEGAGGRVEMYPGCEKNSWEIYADNGFLS